MAISRHSEAVAPFRPPGAFSSWIARHVRTSLASLRRLSGQPFASLMIVLVIAATLAIPAALLLVVRNAAAVSAGWDNALDFSIFLRKDLAVDDARSLAELIGQRADIESVRLVAADEALEEFRRESGFGAALDQLTTNPLPHTLVVRPAGTNTEQSLLVLQQELTDLPEAEIVQVDTEWVQRFHAILDIVKRTIVIVATLLATGIIVIIGNTIRLDIENRREEIAVTKLIGASNAFVRRPFLWSGFWYGLLGGLLAVGLVQYGLMLLDAPVERLAGLYGSAVRSMNLSAVEMLGVVAVSVALGFLGSWIAAARHMRKIEPR